MSNPGSGERCWSENKIRQLFLLLGLIWFSHELNNGVCYLHNKVFANSADDLHCVLVNKVLSMQRMFLVLVD